MIYFSNFFTRKKEKKIQVSKSFFQGYFHTNRHSNIRISETKTARKIEINFFKKVFLPVQND